MRTSFSRGESRNSDASVVNQPRQEGMHTPAANPLFIQEPERFHGVTPREATVTAGTPLEQREDLNLSEGIAKSYLAVKQAIDQQQDGKKPQGAKETKKSQKPQKQVGKYQKQEEPKSSKKYVWLLIILAVVAVCTVTVCILLTTGVINFKTPATEPTTVVTEPPTTAYEPQLGIIMQDMLSLYTDESKSDVAEGVTSDSVSEFFSRLSQAASNGEETGEAVEELNTVLSYIDDSERLSMYEMPVWDVKADAFLSELQTVRASVEMYSVEGLSNSILARVDALATEREEFYRLKTMLLSITDLISFNREDYVDSITALSHTSTKEELIILLAKVTADSKVALAEAMLESAEDVEAAEAELASAKEEQDYATKSWMMYIGEWVEEPSSTEAESDGEVTE